MGIGAESRSGGVIIEGMLYEPQFQVRVDDLGIAQINYSHHAMGL